MMQRLPFEGFGNRLGLLIKRFLAHKNARQALILYVSLVASVPLGIGVSVINTKFLGVKDFGDLKFLQSIWTLGSVATTFGFLATGGNLLAKVSAIREERSIMGALLFIASCIGFLFSICIFGLSFSLGSIYGDELRDYLQIFSPLMLVFPLQLYLQEVLRSINAIGLLALFNLLPQSIYLALAVVMQAFGFFDIKYAIALYLATTGVSAIAVIICIRPSFENLTSELRNIWKRNPTLGFNIYLALLVTAITTQLSQFSLAYFFDTSSVGIFSLAVTVTMPLAMIPNVIATTLFKRFANSAHIPIKVLTITWASSLASLIAFVFVVEPVITSLYAKEFHSAISLAYICAVGAVVHGIGDVYNRFLLSHGQTKSLRNNAVMLGVASVIGYPILVKFAGIVGAAFTKLLIDVLYLSFMLYFYKSFGRTK